MFKSRNHQQTSMGEHSLCHFWGVGGQWPGVVIYDIVFAPSDLITGMQEHYCHCFRLSVFVLWCGKVFPNTNNALPPHIEMPNHECPMQLIVKLPLCQILPGRTISTCSRFLYCDPRGGWVAGPIYLYPYTGVYTYFELIFKIFVVFRKACG